MWHREIKWPNVTGKMMLIDLLHAGLQQTCKKCSICEVQERKWSVTNSLSCLTLCNRLDYTVHGILQARILEWVAVPFSRGSSKCRDRTQVSRIAGRFFTSWATREALKKEKRSKKRYALFTFSESNYVDYQLFRQFRGSNTKRVRLNTNFPNAWNWGQVVSTFQTSVSSVKWGDKWHLSEQGLDVTAKWLILRETQGPGFIPLLSPHVCRALKTCMSWLLMKLEFK